MKMPVHLSRTSIALLLIQLAIVSSIAGKYLYERWRFPRVWTRAAFYSALPMRGHYLALQLTVNGCHSTLPSAKMARFPRNVDGTTRPDGFAIAPAQMPVFPAELKVENNTLLAIRLQNPRSGSDGLMVEAAPGSGCETMQLARAVNFYVAEDTAVPMSLQPDQEIWVEVTVPSSGLPRPLQLALKDNGAWKPLRNRE